MIYLDTSWLVKLYVDEPDSERVRAIVDAQSPRIVGEIAWVEFHSAVERRRREGKLSAREATSLRARLRREWTAYTRVAVSRDVLTRAADLVARRPLRSLDALQIASALLVAKGAPTKPRFGAADARLRDAAEAEGLPIAD